MPNRFLIETFLPLRELSAEARREKAIRHGHISTLHVWWSRKPVVVARAAVLGALLTEDSGVDGAFLAHLCRWEVHDGDSGGRYLLEQLKNLSNASVSWEVHDPTGELGRLQDELEELFRDYGCAVEWRGEPSDGISGE